MLARQLAVLLLCMGCRGPEARRDPGVAAGFRGESSLAVRASLGALLEVCWSRGETGAVELRYLSGRDGREVIFHAGEGASNATGRCLRELALLHPEVPEGGVTVARPPAGRPSGWVVLEYVRLLSASRYGPERGLLDPAPVAAACLGRGLGARQVLHRVRQGQLETFIEVEGELRPTAPVSDTERCVAAVLGATAYPNSRELDIELAPERRPAPSSHESVSAYFAPEVLPARLLPPETIAETLRLRQPQVASCWEEALGRRGALAGGRTFRMRVGAGGEVLFAHVVPHQSTAQREVADYLLDGCLQRVLGEAKFANPTAIEAEAIYSWVFGSR